MEYDLNRFLRAQRDDYERAYREIESGRKRTHWMWYIFPQLKGLGKSTTSEYYGISGAGEARAYLADPILGPRLRTICEALLKLDTNDPLAVMGSPDHFKLQSSMTLFDGISEDEKVFGKVLDKFYGGKKDRRTLAMLGPGEK